MTARAWQLHLQNPMHWLTWFPSLTWQRGAFALALVTVIVAMLMAVRQRSRRSPQKPI
jgi:hypothetical protein